MVHLGRCGPVGSSLWLSPTLKYAHTYSPGQLGDVVHGLPASQPSSLAVHLTDTARFSTVSTLAEFIPRPLGRTPHAHHDVSTTPRFHHCCHDRAGGVALRLRRGSSIRRRTVHRRPARLRLPVECRLRLRADHGPVLVARHRPRRHHRAQRQPDRRHQQLGDP
ncbi:hypothetical protein ACFPRL_23035 [Pseudoclavibacter helvolus]